MRRFISVLALVTFCASGVAFAQDTAKGETKKAGEATKEAGKDTVDAAKHVGKAAVKGTKKGAKATTNATKATANATKDAVQRTYVCVDGTTDEATLKANACKNHGGVKPDAKAKS